MEMKDRLKKLSRYELVELIYELRTDNIELERQLKEAERQLSERPAADTAAFDERLSAMEDCLGKICEKLRIQWSE